MRCCWETALSSAADFGERELCSISLPLSLFLFLESVRLIQTEKISHHSPIVRVASMLSILEKNKEFSLSCSSSSFFEFCLFCSRPPRRTPSRKKKTGGSKQAISTVRSPPSFLSFFSKYARIEASLKAESPILRDLALSCTLSFENKTKRNR